VVRRTWGQALAGLFGLTGDFGLTGLFGVLGVLGVTAVFGVLGVTAVFGVLGVLGVTAVSGVFAVFGVTAVGSTAGRTPAVASTASEPDCTVVTELELCWVDNASKPLANAATGVSATAAAPPARIHLVLVNICHHFSRFGSAPLAADKN
jgi:hypothetical protein